MAQPLMAASKREYYISGTLAVVDREFEIGNRAGTLFLVRQFESTPSAGHRVGCRLGLLSLLIRPFVETGTHLRIFREELRRPLQLLDRRVEVLAAVGQLA